MKNKHGYNILFVLIVAALSFYYNYHNILPARPQGTHLWRQCDGASIARNYYYNGMHFMQPELNILLGNEGNMVGEFPVVYYVAAALYHVFGFHESILRILHLLIFYVGLFYLFQTVNLILKDRFYALICSLLVFASATIVFYAPNFLPDVPALSFTFMAYYYLLYYLMSDKSKTALYKAAALFALAGLLKLTALIGLVAVGVVWVYDLAFTPSGNREGLWGSVRSIIIFFILAFTPAMLWILWARHYNAINGNSYFLTATKPIWDASADKVQFILGLFNYKWLRQYFYRDFINAMPVIVLAIFLIPQKERAYRWLIWLAAFIVLSILYVLLFFTQFEDHDYYIICIMLLPVAICTILLMRLKQWQPAIYNSVFLKGAMLLLLIISLYHCNRVGMDKFAEGQYDIAYVMGDVEPYLDSLGIDINSKIVVLGDQSTCVSLYLMNRRGWTDYAGNKPQDVQNHINKGAGYLVILPQWRQQNNIAAYQAFTEHKLGEHKQVTIYKL